jgi:hypothetical protein
MKRYIVKFYGGGGGHFLQELILWCETQEKTTCIYPTAHAHNTFTKWLSENVENGKDQNTVNHRLTSNSPYDFLITHGFEANDIFKIYQRDPENFRMIHVVMQNPLELALCEYNHFYKNQRIEYKKNKIDYGLFPHYKNLMNSRGYEEVTMPDWQTVSTEDMAQILINRTVELCGHSLAGMKNNYRYKTLQKIPHTELTVTDVMENSQKILETISTLVGKPITDAMYVNCNRYVNAQLILRKRFPAYELIKESYSIWNPI